MLIQFPDIYDHRQGTPLTTMPNQVNPEEAGNEIRLTPQTNGSQALPGMHHSASLETAIARVDEERKRWRAHWNVKPRIALALPPEFTLDEAFARGEVAAGLDLIGKLLPFADVAIFSTNERARQALAPLPTISSPEGCFAAIAVLDRAFAESLAQMLPTRLLGTDTTYFVPEKWRHTFAKVSVTPAQDAPRVTAPATVYLDHLFPRDRIAALGERFADARFVVSRHVTYRHLLAQQGHTVEEAGDPSAFTSPRLPAAKAFVTDPAATRLLPSATLVTSSLGLSRADFAPRDLVLYAGEDENPADLLDRLFDRPRTVPPTLTKPLISIVVPVYNRTDDIMRVRRIRSPPSTIVSSRCSS